MCQYINLETGRKDYKTIIPCNLYGAYDKFDPQNSHLIPAIIHIGPSSKIHNSDVVEIWGDGTARENLYTHPILQMRYFVQIDDFKRAPELFNCE